MWQYHYVVNTMKALMPFQDQLRAVKRHVSPPCIGAQHESVISGGFDHAAALREAGLRLEGARVLELGTGWFPIIPLMLRAAGSQTVYLTDVHRLMDKDTLLAALDFVSDNAGRIAAGLAVPPGRVEDLVAEADTGKSLDDLLADLGLVYIAPFDVTTQMPEVDAIVSHTVFEHIPPGILREILVHARKGLRPGGMMSHGIDNTDHRANKDDNLDRFDFLRYSDGAWKLLCVNPQDYTNRMRHSDYVALFSGTGYEVIHEKTYVLRESLPRLQSARLEARFSQKEPEDLAVAWSHIVIRQPASGAASGAAAG